MEHVYHYTITIPGTATLDRIDEIVKWLRTRASVIQSPTFGDRTIIVNHPIDWRDHGGFPPVVPANVLPEAIGERAVFHKGVDWAFTQVARRPVEAEVRGIVEPGGWMVSDWQEVQDDGDRL